MIEFPDSHLFEKVNLANAHSFITIYDCVDDWEEFAKAGQAIWYDAAVERYLCPKRKPGPSDQSAFSGKIERDGSVVCANYSQWG